MAALPSAGVAVRASATIDNFLAMECHAVGFMSWWQELVKWMTKPFFDQGYVTVPDRFGKDAEVRYHESLRE